MRGEHRRAALRALTAWDIDVSAFELVSVSENIAFRVAGRRGGAYVLRLHRPWYHTLDELVSEQTWTAALRAAGVDAPVAVPTREGQGYERVRVDDELRYAGLLEWVDGTTLGEEIGEAPLASSVRDRFAALGGIMASIHNQATGWTPPPGFKRHALDADGLMGERPFWGRFWESPALDAAQRRRLAALRERIHAILCGDPRLRDDATYSLIHADLHPYNVVVSGSRLHVIDFDDAGFGWHAYDFAVALSHHKEHPEFDAIRDALVAGYRRVRPIADDTVALVPLFLLIRSLASIGWIAARPELWRKPTDDRATHLMRDVDSVADAVLGEFS